MNGKIALVTGGSRGIGRAVCRELAACGCGVAVVYGGNEEAAEETCKLVREAGCRAEKYACRVEDYASVESLVKQVISDFGTVDILVNSAGIVRDKLMLAMTETDFDEVLDVNLKGVFNTVKQLYPVFLRKRGGRIINISSVSGLMGNAGQANYSASKAGVVGLTKTVARELASRGVTCNAVAPGFIETDMTGALSGAVLSAAMGAIPMRRMGGADEVAALVAFLASDKAAYITGEVIKVDGGLYI